MWFLEIKMCAYVKKCKPNKEITLNVIDSNKNACLWKKILT